MPGWMDGEIILQTPKFQVLRRVLPGSAQATYVVDHPGAVAILPILDDGRLVFVRNRRHSIQEELLEIPAGTLRPGESPQAGAVRELLEETGYRARIWQEIIDFYVSPGITNEKMTLYYARGLESGQAHPEPDEDLHVELLSREECLAALEAGAIRDAKSLIALLLYFFGDRDLLSKLEKALG